MRAAPRFGVLLIGNFLSSSRGTRCVCEELADRLAARGWTVISASDRPGAFARLRDMLATVWRERPRYSVAQIDVYSGRAFIWAELVSLTLRLLGKPYLLILRGGSLPRFARRWPWRVRRLLRSAHAVAVPSPYLLRQMTPYCADVQLLPNPIEVGDYPFRLRAQPDPTLVWLRAFLDTYNPTLAPRVLALLSREFSDIRLSMVGPDWGDGTLEAARRVARQLGIDDRIVWAGSAPKSAVPAWLDRGDIFLNTANVDNTPISVLEAMACGLCVVSTNVGGMPDLARHNHDALLVPPDDAEAMAAAIRRVLTERGLAASLSATARRTVEQYDWAVVLPLWEQLFTALADGTRAPIPARAPDPLAMPAPEIDRL
jgi:glycosyltransferase involved in cell wall biosynthesis